MAPLEETPMTQKFNPKQYQGKKRVYVKVPLSPNISRLYIWSEEAHEYLTPVIPRIDLNLKRSIAVS